METETAWRVRRVVLAVFFLLIVAMPLYPELYGVDEISPFTQLVAFRPQALVVIGGITPTTFRTYRIEGSDQRAAIADVAVPKQS
jgi:hypothetical protein